MRQAQPECVRRILVCLAQPRCVTRDSVLAQHMELLDLLPRAYRNVWCEPRFAVAAASRGIPCVSRWIVESMPLLTTHGFRDFRKPYFVIF